MWRLQVDPFCPIPEAFSSAKLRGGPVLSLTCPRLRYFRPWAGKDAWKLEDLRSRFGFGFRL